MRTQKNQDGITLLVTLLLMTVLLGVSTSLLNVTLKQYQLSGIAYSSEVAFHAADAGMECAHYKDRVDGDFALGARGNITCFDGISSPDLNLSEGDADSGDEQLFAFSWPDAAAEMCTEISVYKFNPGESVEVEGVDLRPSGDCPTEGNGCTVIKTRGYNTTCAQKTTGGRVVERELTQVY